MTEAIRAAVEVWNAMQRDPKMVSGLTIGQLEDLADGVAELMKDVAVVRRSIPLAMMLSFNKLGEASVEQVVSFMNEMLNVKAVRAELDRRATS